jgi:hypothetical protein
MFWFTDDDPTFEQVAAIADGVHVLTDEMCWLTWYSMAQSKIVLSRLNFPEMTDPLDPYTKWWIVGDSSPTRFAFPKMYMYSQTDSNIYEGNKKSNGFIIQIDKEQYEVINVEYNKNYLNANNLVIINDSLHIDITTIVKSEFAYLFMLPKRTLS